MKYIRLLLLALCLVPGVCGVARAQSNEFMVAAQLLAAAKNADIQQVQLLINNGADVNYVDSTGLSIVCTALMNKDVRAAQILQMYGADASQCDRQIKNYNSKTKPKKSGGLFGGLSSAQTLTLAAAGAAVVVGGLLLLTDVFDPGNDNDNSSSGTGDRPGQGGNTNTPSVGTAAFTVPYGPAMPGATAEQDELANNVNAFSSTTDGILKDNFALMTDGYQQNYMLMMGGYYALARGYLGMRTLRNLYTGDPIDLKGNNFGSDQVMGDRPGNVALITANGINAAPKPNGELSAQKNSLDDFLLAWTTPNQNGTATNGASNRMLSSKYYNNKIEDVDEIKSLADGYTVEDGAQVNFLDLSGHGTAVNNTAATDTDNLLAKIVGGGLSGYTAADFYGFMPNGQMTIFRTGGGRGFVALAAEETPNTGSYTVTDGKLTALTLFGTEFTVTQTGTTFVAKNAADDTAIYNGYIGADGTLYIASSANSNDFDQAYSMGNDGVLKQTMKLGNLEYKNYEALYNAAVYWRNGDAQAGGRSRPGILANASVIEPLSVVSAARVGDLLAVDSKLYKAAFSDYVNSYYANGQEDATVGSDAVKFFTGLGSAWSPLVIFSTGAAQTSVGTISAGANPWQGAALDATFENTAPLVFDNLNHLFMSVVAVGQSGAGTKGVTTAYDYSPSSDAKYTLAIWSDNKGTTDTTDDVYYKARKCGIAGSGANGVDPWCFAAAGVTDERAVAAAAGAAGVVSSAFYNISKFDNKQLFVLLALTADGPYLATSDNGTAYNKETLTAYLQGLYDLPNEYQLRYLNGEDYLTLFKDVFGYGMINVERATKPGASVYYYDGTKISSANGNAYWRAATATNFRASSVLGMADAKITAPFFDVLESVDGELSLPRVWKNEFNVGGNTRHALYMGDVLADLKTGMVPENRFQIGNLGFSVSTASRQYVDNLNGLENLHFDYSGEKWDFGAGYQHYFTDGVSRFSGLANPVLAMASNAIVTDAEYKFGRWGFGGRAFSGDITDEGLLENDPTVSSQFNPARLGRVMGAQSYLAWRGDAFDVTTSVGAMNETGTLLGAQTGGLLDLGNGRTSYIDTLMRYRPSDNFTLMLRSTFARTRTDANGEYIIGLTDLESDAFAMGADVGNFSFALSRPLATYRGALRYAYADYDVVENSDGKYDLVVNDTHIQNIALHPDNRELRFMASYRHSFGEFTDGALGVIYRIHPNNTDDFGNESIFMMKINHRLGI